MLIKQFQSNIIFDDTFIIAASRLQYFCLNDLFYHSHQYQYKKFMISITDIQHARTHTHNKKNEMNRALGHFCAHIG